jgi:hypothetical protein
MKPVAWMIDTEDQFEAMVTLFGFPDDEDDRWAFDNGRAFALSATPYKSGSLLNFDVPKWFQDNGYHLIDLRKREG